MYGIAKNNSKIINYINQTTMRKIFVSNVVSLDGYYESPNAAFDFFTPNEAFFEYARNMMREAGAIMYGRVTYKFMEAYWPNVKDNDDVIAERMNNHTKIVFSKTLTITDWGETIVLNDVNAEDIIKLKQQPGGDIVILGSGQIVQALSNLGLIDEYRIIVAPVILGSGNPMFNGVQHRIPLKLTQAKELGDGIMLLYYQPANS